MLNPDMPDQELRLHMGELTADEMLFVRATIRWANSQMNGFAVNWENRDLTQGEISKLKHYLKERLL